MKSVKYGQRVKFLFDDWFETAEYKDALSKLPEGERKPENVKISRAKTIKVYLGRIDQEFLDGFEEENSGRRIINNHPPSRRVVRLKNINILNKENYLESSSRLPKSKVIFDISTRNFKTPD